MRFVMIFTLEANWDEFLNLSMLYDHYRGELREILQTGFIHLFHWLPSVSENEVDQIVAARIVVFAVSLVTAMAIYKVSRVFSSVNAALVAVLCYCVFSYTLQHGGALRTDSFATCAMMCALWLSITAPLKWTRVVLAGLFTGLAGFFTIKAVFYVPALVLVTLIKGTRDRTLLQACSMVLAAGATAALSFVCLTYLHASSFDTVSSPLSFLERTTGATLVENNYAILRYYGNRAIQGNTVVVVLLVLGLASALWTFVRGPDRLQSGLTLSLLMPLLSVFFYSETYPYFFPFILPPAMVFCALACDVLTRRLGEVFVSTVAVVLVVAGSFVFVGSPRTLADQRSTLAVVHQLFPLDVAYIDARSMVSSKPKRGIFMSRWGMRDYRHQDEPIMRDILDQQNPQFLLANGTQLLLSGWSAEQSQAHPAGLLGEDMLTLQDNFLQFWGPLYVPGKTISPGKEAITVLLPGRYRVEGESLLLNGRQYRDGDKIILAKGRSSVAVEANVKLVRDLPVPLTMPPNGPLFQGF